MLADKEITMIEARYLAIDGGLMPRSVCYELIQSVQKTNEQRKQSKKSTTRSTKILVFVFVCVYSCLIFVRVCVCVCVLFVFCFCFGGTANNSWTMCG